MDISKENLIDAIAQVGHPSINASLVELGIIQNISLDGKAVHLTYVFPFPEIPIADQLIAAVKGPLNAMGYSFTYDTRIMTEAEKEKFLEMEAKGWKG